MKSEAVGFYAITSLSLLAISGVLIFWLLNRGLAPLRELAAEASAVSVDSWNFAPPQRARMIRELAPLIVALEKVLAGLEHSFMQQRRFVAMRPRTQNGRRGLKVFAAAAHVKQRTAPEYERGSTLPAGLRAHGRNRSQDADPGAGRTNTAPTSVATDLADTLRRVSEQFESMAELSNCKSSVLLRAR